MSLGFSVFFCLPHHLFFYSDNHHYVWCVCCHSYRYCTQNGLRYLIVEKKAKGRRKKQVRTAPDPRYRSDFGYCAVECVMLVESRTPFCCLVVLLGNKRCDYWHWSVSRRASTESSVWHAISRATSLTYVLLLTPSLRSSFSFLKR